MTGKAPRPDPRRCARAALPLPLCDVCESVCPVGAITVPAETRAPVIDAETCNRCGACAAACPEAAFPPPVPPPDPSERTWSLVCSGADPEQDLCLNALSIADLALAWAGGVREIEIAEHDCADCDRAGARPFADTLARFNRLAQSRGAASLCAKRVPRPRKSWWQRLAGDGAPDPARRAILRGRPGRGEDDRAAALEEFLALERGSSGPLFPYAPTIDPARCTGCDACVRGCPNGAFQIVAGERPAYVVAAKACTGCGLCVALCDDDAISVTIDGRVGPPVALEAFRCQSCKTMTHRPENSGDDHAELCYICAERQYPRPDNLVL
ncbi:ferredoxin family protein [Jhaorihella thermophila]|uniref:4Fe-4S dicluster domain-containing protein n=1 Tax=Jhaorihella thermophila TaxID=488547 RepID=A0A1H5YVM6_9RHOB|nr:4Fe-4S dicluster domain-containing protein [Jhaorihella thermophila]